MRSLFSGVSGLKVHQTKMDVIGNNISNVNTTGFKSSRATFNEIFSQTLSGASAPNANSGRAGTNAMQVGLGVSVSSIDNNMTEGAAQRTDRPEDLKIEGDAFFIVGDASGKYFTRAGDFKIDKDGSLGTFGGLKVYGWNVDAAGEIQKGQVVPIDIMSSTNMYNPPEMTRNITFEKNIFTDDGTVQQNISFYDSLGNKFTAALDFTYDSTTKVWSVDFPTVKYKDPADPTGVNMLEGKLMYMNGSKEPIVLTANSPLKTLEFNENGRLPEKPASASQFTLNISAEGLPVNSVFSEILVDFGKLTQFNEQSTVTVSNDGINPGNLSSYSIDQSGIITGSYTNGTTKTFGQIAVTTFKNPAGLEKIGNNLFTTTPNSGDFNGIGQDPTVGGGKINSSTLEMSNVDLASEFTDMITTQRGFQANSKIITTSDEMLQELVNLKR